MNGWTDLAECRGMDPELFYPGRGRADELAAAVAVCNRCVMRAACLDDALAHETGYDGQRYGVRGGLSARARKYAARDARQVAS